MFCFFSGVALTDSTVANDGEIIDDVDVKWLWWTPSEYQTMELNTVATDLTNLRQPPLVILASSARQNQRTNFDSRQKWNFPNHVRIETDNLIPTDYLITVDKHHQSAYPNSQQMSQNVPNNVLLTWHRTMIMINCFSIYRTTVKTIQTKYELLILKGSNHLLINTNLFLFSTQDMFHIAFILLSYMYILLGTCYAWLV